MIPSTDISSLDRENRKGLSEFCLFFGYSDPQECERSDEWMEWSKKKNTFVIYNFQYTFVALRNVEFLLIIGIVTFLTLSSLFLNFIFLHILIRGRNSAFKPAVYVVISQISVCYLLNSLCQLFLSIPLYVFGVSLPDTLSLFFLFLDLLSDYGSLVFYTLLTLNRFSVFVYKPIKGIFKSRIPHTLLVGWLIALIPVSFSFIYGCTRRYDEEKKVYMDECKPAEIIMFHVYQIIYKLFYIVPFLNLLFYLIVLNRIRDTRYVANVDSGKVEKNMLIQTLVIFILYMISVSISLLETVIKIPTANVLLVFYFLNIFIDLLISCLFVISFYIINDTFRKFSKKMFSERITITQQSIPISIVRPIGTINN